MYSLNQLVSIEHLLYVRQFTKVERLNAIKMYVSDIAVEYYVVAKKRNELQKLNKIEESQKLIEYKKSII